MRAVRCEAVQTPVAERLTGEQLTPQSWRSCSEVLSPRPFTRSSIYYTMHPYFDMNTPQNRSPCDSIHIPAMWP
jgi:hypothetical protein